VLKWTQYNLSGANGWSIGTGPSYNSNISGTVVGSWYATEPTALIIWEGTNKSEFNNLFEDATYSLNESLNVDLQSANYNFIFTTQSSIDTVIIVQNIIFLPNSH
jgi:hypothetical protein